MQAIVESGKTHPLSRNRKVFVALVPSLRTAAAYKQHLLPVIHLQSNQGRSFEHCASAQNPLAVRPNWAEFMLSTVVTAARA